MTDDKQGQPTPDVDRPGERARAFNAAMATLGIAIVVFIVGVVVGFPLATFGVEFVTSNGGLVFGLLFGFLVLVLVVTAILMIFRRQIWESLFKRGEVEMERFARPLSEVARFAALQKVAEATESARDLAELVLARYAWVSTRRWLMATITAFIAAIAALAGSTFRNTIFGVADFSGADLKSVDFDGAIVFDPAFPDTVAAQAAPDSFVRERFAIAPIAAEEFARHPRWSDARLDGLEKQQAYRITRVGAFE